MVPIEIVIVSLFRTVADDVPLDGRVDDSVQM
jgi:hypothetical protein